MSLRRSKLVKGIENAISLGAIAAIGVTGTATAQSIASGQASQQKPQTLQTVVVTGSHISRVDVETDNPVVTVSPQQIQATGKLTIGDVVKQLPVITGGMTNSANSGFNGGQGTSKVGIRGLGASRTLILVDGQRIVNKDLNTIPAAAIQRIELLTSGAAAIYGSDAIGGVINFILKSNFNGAEFSANYGMSSHHDAKRRSASFIYGKTDDKGSLLAGIDYNKADALLGSARKLTANAYELTTTAGGTPKVHIGGSSSAARDFVAVDADLARQFGCSTGRPLALNVSAWTADNSPTKPGDYHCYSSDGDAFNYLGWQLIQTPAERVNTFIKGTYHVTDNVDLYATILHNQTSSSTQSAPPTFTSNGIAGVTISADSYYNPFGVTFSRTAGAGYRSRLYPAGARRRSYDHTTDQAMVGVKGNLSILDRNWTWDVGYNYGRIALVRTTYAPVNFGAIVPGLGPSFMNGDGVVQCGTPADPISLDDCTPWDGFNLNSASAQAYLSSDAVHANGTLHSWRMERTWHADASGGLFDLPAGTMQLAAGISYRKEYSNNSVDAVLRRDPVTNTCTLGSGCSAHLQGGFSVKEAYAELFIPLLQGLPLVHGLNVTLGERYSKYSTFGSTSNWKIGVEYRPINDLLLRGTISRVFRAPTIDDLFSPPSGDSPYLDHDPCDHITVASPACKGVPLDGTFENSYVATTTQYSALVEGSQYSGLPLGPEVGKSFDFGVVYSPHFVPGLSLSADVWRIYLTDTITDVGGQTVLDACFAGSSKYCPLIVRTQSGPNAGQFIHIVEPITNLGRIDVKGADFAGQYRLPAFWFGQLQLGVNLTYMDQFKIQTAPGEPGNQVLNGDGLMAGEGTSLGGSCPFSSISQTCFFPHVRGRGTVRWNLGPWSAQWTFRYIGRFRIAGSPPGRHLQGIDDYGTTVYNDVTAGYDIAAIKTRINVGVNNLFSKDAPLIFDSRTLNANTDTNDFDVFGRYYWARITVDF